VSVELWTFKSTFFSLCIPCLPLSYRHSTSVPCRQHQSRGWCWHEAESAFQLVNGGGGSSDSSQHDRGSRFRSRRCPRVEQFTVVCHIIVVTVDFQTTFEDVLVCDLVLMALLTLCLSLSTEHVVFFLCVMCPCSFWTKCHTNLLVNNNNNGNLVLRVLKNNNNNNLLTKRPWVIYQDRLSVSSCTTGCKWRLNTSAGMLIALVVPSMELDTSG